jgi:hypothetical protein
MPITARWQAAGGAPDKPVADHCRRLAGSPKMSAKCGATNCSAFLVLRLTTFTALRFYGDAAELRSPFVLLTLAWRDFAQVRRVHTHAVTASVDEVSAWGQLPVCQRVDISVRL